MTLVAQGKVRDIFEAGADRLLIVATDRISAFDVILPTPIPHKGRVLTACSLFWFEQTADIAPNHVVTADRGEFPPPYDADVDLAGRATLVRTADVIPMECVVRGYLAGSGWSQYRARWRGVRAPAARRPARVLATARADLHADHQGRGGPRSAAHAGGGARPGRHRPVRAIARGEHRGLRADRRTGTAPRPDRRGHEVRVRVRSRDARAHADRRARHARLVAVLARRHIRAGARAAVVRQAVRARLARRERLEPRAAATRAPRRRRGGHGREVPRSVRAHQRRAVRRLPPPDGSTRDDRVHVRSAGLAEAGLLDPQGKAVEGSLPAMGWTTSRAFGSANTSS